MYELRIWMISICFWREINRFIDVHAVRYEDNIGAVQLSGRSSAVCLLINECYTEYRDLEVCD